jgi:hypothetical protein
MTDVSFEGRLRSIETASAVSQVHDQNIESRLGSIEDTLKWLVRLIIGALLVGVLSGIIAMATGAPI